MSFTLRAKRTLVGALAMTMVISLMPAGVASAFEEEKEAVCENAGDSGFTDLAGSVHADNIECMFAYGIGSGYPDDTFRPGQPITRDQMATLLTTFAVVATDGAVLDLIDEDIEVPFTDIEGNTHEANIEALYRLDIVSGRTDTTYNPRGLVSRDQYATFVVQAHEALGVDFDELLDEVDSPFTDIAGNVHEANIETLYSAELVVGQTPTTYNPSGDVQRGQVMTVLANSAGVLEALGIWAAPRLDPPAPDPGQPNTNFTTAPELLQVNRTAEEDVVEFIFSEPVTGQALQRIEFPADGSLLGVADEASCNSVGALNFDEDATGAEAACFLYSDLLLYDVDGNAAWPYEARIQADRVFARFAGSATTFGITGDVEDDNNIVDDAVRATARENAVQDVTRAPSIAGQFGLPVLDETAVEVNDFEPRLVSVEDYRTSDLSILGQTRVLVDFVFDGRVGDLPGTLGDIEGTTDGDEVTAGEFFLVGNFGAEYQGLVFVEGEGDATAIVDAPDPDATTVTVALAQDPTQVPETGLRRGYVITGDTAAADTTSPAIEVKDLIGDFPDEDGNTDNVVLSALWEDTDGSTADPDLISAARVSPTSDRVTFVFDEAISDVVDEFDFTQFFVYDGDGNIYQGEAAFPSATEIAAASSIVVEFSDLPTTADAAPVGAFVGDGAVTATDNLASVNAGENRPAQVRLSLLDPDFDSDDFFEFTARPDLESVTVTQNSVTQNYRVAFEFDSALATPDAVSFYLHDRNGTKFTVEGDVAGRSISTNNRVVTFSVDAGFTVLTNEQIEAAVTGSVETTVLFEANDAATELIPENIAGGVTLPTEGQKGVNVN